MRWLLRSQVPRRVRWLMNTIAVAIIGWTTYCLYAWVTHSGIWRITWNTIASYQRDTPRSLDVAFISWGLGLGALLVVGWPLQQVLLRRGTTST